MCATPNSGSVLRLSGADPFRRRGRVWLLCLCWLCAQAGAAETNLISTNLVPAKISPGERLDKQLRTARTQFLADTNNAIYAWQLGRACFEWNENLKDPNQQEKFAKEGIAASRQAVALAPPSAPAHYYLGLTLGQFADTKRNMAALKMVKEMEREFQTTRELDEHFDFGGADRNLGLLYHQAPTIISIGSRSKARLHLQRAVELAPEFPENRLNLIETLLEWGDHAAARRELKALEKIWPDAEKNFSGETWADAWAEWKKRRDRLRESVRH